MTCALHQASDCSLNTGSVVIGSDEVGWGAVAGPLFVVAVAAQKSWRFRGLRDSKKYADKAERADVFERLTEELRGHWALATYSPSQIDQLGAQHCLIEAHTRVLQELLAKTPKSALDRVIVDGSLQLPSVRDAVAIPKADANFPVVSAASVLAKVLRDGVMVALARSFPQYGFETHVGYGTSTHMRAIKNHGLCPAHRRSYLKKSIKP